MTTFSQATVYSRMLGLLPVELNLFGNATYINPIFKGGSIVDFVPTPQMGWNSFSVYDDPEKVRCAIAKFHKKRMIRNKVLQQKNQENYEKMLFLQ